MIPPISRTPFLVTLILAFALSPAAWAGGSFQPPDGVGNPSGNDYTGFKVVGYVYGVRHNTGLHTEFQCTNTGGVDSEGFVVQLYNTGDVASRTPVADLDRNCCGVGFFPISDLDFTDTRSVSGAAPDLSFARILVTDSNRRKNPALVCHVVVKDTASGNPIMPLDVISPKKKKK